MYVPGTLENTKSVLVNIGTGYYVEKVSKVKFCLKLYAQEGCSGTLVTWRCKGLSVWGFEMSDLGNCFFLGGGVRNFLADVFE